jgi:nitrite reductase (NADH) small subunit
MNALTDDWIDIGAVDEIPPRGARVVRTPRGCLAVFRTGADEVFALDDRCPHKGGPLSQGIVHGRAVTCPLHNWVIGLESGAAEGPDDGRVRTHGVRVEAGRILLDPAGLGPHARSDRG